METGSENSAADPVAGPFIRPELVLHEKTWGFDKKGDGVRFHVFEELSHPAAFNGVSLSAPGRPGLPLPPILPAAEP